MPNCLFALKTAQYSLATVCLGAGVGFIYLSVEEAQKEQASMLQVAAYGTAAVSLLILAAMILKNSCKQSKQQDKIPHELTLTLIQPEEPSSVHDLGRCKGATTQEEISAVLDVLPVLER